jgi:hypothetical protein
MKLKALLAVAALGVMAACNTPYRATDTTVVEAPDGVRTTFTTQYPTATNIVWNTYDPAMVPVDWELSGWGPLDRDDYLVRFDLDSENYYAWYDSDGNWVGSAYAVRDLSTVPAEVNNAVKNQFADYTISSVNREFHKDRMVYEVEAKNSTNKVKLLVDAEGNIIKQKTKPLD